MALIEVMLVVVVTMMLAIMTAEVITVVSGKKVITVDTLAAMFYTWVFWMGCTALIAKFVPGTHDFLVQSVFSYWSWISVILIYWNIFYLSFNEEKRIKNQLLNKKGGKDGNS